MKFSYQLSWLFLICLMMAGCQEEPVRTTPDHLSGVNETSGPEIARRLSIQIRDVNFRKSLKTSLLQQFDGDYNVLWSMVPASMDIGPSKDPLWQVAMPSLTSMNASEWDDVSHIPLVVYRPPGIDLNSVSSLSAYIDGREIPFDITQEPDNLVLVVSHNERVIFSPKNKPLEATAGRICEVEPVLQDETYDYYLKSSLNDCNSGGSGGGGSSGTSGCDRDQYSRKDHVTRAKFATINIFRQAEHYLDGNPEVFFIVTLASKNPSGFSSLRKSYPSRDRSQWKDCGIFSCSTEWRDNALPVFDWDPLQFGELVRYDWFEEDYSKAKVDLTLGLSTKISDVSVSGGVKVTINEEDYFLDQDFVDYCDNANGQGTTYNTGKLYFTVNHQ